MTAEEIFEKIKYVDKKGTTYGDILQVVELCNVLEDIYMKLEKMKTEKEF